MFGSEISPETSIRRSFREIKDTSPGAVLRRSFRDKRQRLSFRLSQFVSNANKMSEGRKTQVVLLDDRRLEILIQPKLYAGELLDIVASHFSLKEKEYFGLSYKDDTGHHHWLQLDRKVLEHEFPKKTGPLVLFFNVRFFIESIAYLKDSATIELFYLQAKQGVFKGSIECDSDSAFELAANVLQAANGDYIDDESSRKQLKKLPILPTSCLKEHPSISYCEDQVIQYYRKLADQSRGSSIVNYMTIVESLPTYGIHYYEVKDKAGLPWWLGLSFKGISQFDYNDKKTPRRVFAWKQLENLYFRDKKFSIEVHDPKRVVHTLSSFNLYEDAISEPIEDFDELSDAISDPTTQVSVSRRTFGPGNVNVHAWFTSCSALTKCIWSMAVSQHQFYLDRKQSKSTLPTVRSMSEIAADLCQSTSSLPSSASGDDISRSNSAHSLTTSISTNNAKLELTAEDLEASRAAQRDMFTALTARKEALEEALKKKTEELRTLCMKEGELTGELPSEIPLFPGEPVPQVRRRVGTAFTVIPKIIANGENQEDEQLAKLELEFQLQENITKAAQRLAHDLSVGKAVRKQRRQSYNKALQKLKEIENLLNDVRLKVGQAPVKIQSSIEGDNEQQISSKKNNVQAEESEFISPVSSPAVSRSHLGNEPGQVKIFSSPKVEVVEMEHPGSPSGNNQSLTPGNHAHPGAPASPHQQRGISRGSTPSPNTQRQYVGGYTPSAVYQTRTQYRNQMYPTFSMRSQSVTSNQSEYDNVSSFHGRRVNELTPSENIHNAYNVNTHQTLQYDSADELKTPGSEDERTFMDESERLRLPSKHGSLEGAYRRYNHGDGNYPDLSRYGHSAADDLVLPSLTPSRFGSKRESTQENSHYGGGNEGVYQINEGMSRLSHLDSGSDSMSQSGSSTHEYPMHPQGGYPYNPDVRNSSSFMSTTTSSYESSYSASMTTSPQKWYETDSSPVLRQQLPPQTPQYEPPTQTCIQQEPLQASFHHEQHAAVQTPQRMTTYTKYQSYVEVSKPFEMSDFYKYSEKLRKQRTIQMRQQKLEQVLGGESFTHGPDSPLPGPPVNYPVSYSSDSTPLTSPGHYSSGVTSPSSPYNPHSAPGSQPTSPFSHVQDSFYANSPPSPVTHHRSRQPYTQSNLTHNYGSQNYASTPHSHTGSRQYQPPQLMNCEPMRDSPNPSSSGQNTPQRLVSP